MHVTFRMVGKAMGIRNARGWLALRTGHCEITSWPPGTQISTAVPHSMSDMDVAELEAFWDDAREVIKKEVLPHVEASAAEQIGWRLDDLRNQ